VNISALRRVIRGAALQNATPGGLACNNIYLIVIIIYFLYHPKTVAKSNRSLQNRQKELI
jgi:hypothetical protein